MTVLDSLYESHKNFCSENISVLHPGIDKEKKTNKLKNIADTIIVFFNRIKGLFYVH